MQVIDEWRLKGIKLGKREGEAGVLIKQLNLRLGKLPAEVEERIQNLSEDGLNRLTEALLNFSNLAELETWLAQQS